MLVLCTTVVWKILFDYFVAKKIQEKIFVDCHTYENNLTTKNIYNIIAFELFASTYHTFPCRIDYQMKGAKRDYH